MPARRRAGRPPLSESRGEDTRERILEVATELFATRGYHGAGVAEIGGRAGIRPGALYYHIGSKEQLLFDVLRRHVEQSLEGEEAIAAAGLEPADKLRRLVAHHVATIVEHRAAVQIYAREADHLTGERAAELQALRDRVQAIWQQVIDDGVRQGAFRTADHVVVNGILGLVNFVYLWYQPEGALTADEIAERFCDVLLDGLRAAPDRRRRG